MRGHLDDDGIRQPVRRLAEQARAEALDEARERVRGPVRQRPARARHPGERGDLREELLDAADMAGQVVDRLHVGPLERDEQRRRGVAHVAERDAPADHERQLALEDLLHVAGRAKTMIPRAQQDRRADEDQLDAEFVGQRAGAALHLDLRGVVGPARDGGLTERGLLVRGLVRTAEAGHRAAGRHHDETAALCSGEPHHRERAIDVDTAHVARIVSGMLHDGGEVGDAAERR